MSRLPIEGSPRPSIIRCRSKTIWRRGLQDWLQLLAPLSMILAMGCGALAPDGGTPGANDLLFRVETDVIRSKDAPEVGQLRFLGYVTPAEGPEAIDRVSAVGTGDRGASIVVADVPSCEIRFVKLAGGSARDPIGRCGEGPGEFSMISGLEMRGDTVYAMDPNRQLIQVLTNDGTEVRRFRLQDLLPSVPGRFSWGQMISAQDFLLIRAVNGLAEGEAESGLDWRSPVIRLTLTEIGEPTVTSAALLVPSFSEDVAQRAKLVPPLRVCAHVDRRTGTVSRVVVTQRLAVESVVLDAALRPLTRHVTSLPWAEPVRDSMFPGGWRWGMLGSTVACGAQYYAHGVRSFDGNDERIADIHGRIEIRRYDGTLVVARNWGRDNPEAVQIGAPRALLGDTLVTTLVDENGWQRVAAWLVGMSIPTTN